MSECLKPLIEQRADPFVYRHSDGYYYFTASVPAYNGIELRRAKTIEGLASAPTRMVWIKPDKGPFSDLIWAPEIHFNDEAWYVYFAAAPSREIKNDLFQHRMYAISCKDENPLEGTWEGPVLIETPWDTFCLDATTFRHKGQLYYLWAQKHPEIRGNSNLYLAPMENPVTIKGTPVMLTKPEFDWEIRGFRVNEGPGILRSDSRLFVTYSASATDENYAVGLLWVDLDSDLMDISSWSKSQTPVFQSCFEHGIYGPGHNSFTRSEADDADVLVFHARTYTEIEGDPLWDPNRHTFVKKVKWKADGFPDFGKPSQP